MHPNHYNVICKLYLSDIRIVDIADDNLIFASTIAEHDLTLQNVFQRLFEKGLTLNLDTRLFSKETLE